MVSEVPYREAQMLIDEEIATLRAQAQKAESLLIARRNAVAPAAKLPNEVLVDIFLLSRDTSEPGARDWLPVCQICRHWRLVAVGTASLWTQIYVRSLAFTVLMLKRSQQAPLEIHFPLHRWRSSSYRAATVTAVIRQIARIRTLSFVEQDASILEVAHEELARIHLDAGILENLTVHIRDTEAADHQLGLALEVFRTTNGRLRALSLSNLQLLGWNTLLSVASGLRQLTLREVDTAAPISGARFSEVLRQMVNLEKLSLSFDDIQLHQYTAPTARTPAAARLKPIDLPWLKSLEIRSRSRLEPVEAFLVHASYPRLQNLCITCGDSENRTDYATVIRAMASSIRKGGFGTPEVLKIFGDRFFVSPALGVGSPYVDVFLPLTTDLRGEETDVAIVMDILACLVPQSPPNSDAVSSLRNLYLGNLLLPADDFIHLFGYLPHLESIEVFGELALVLFEALAITSLPDQDLAPNSPIAFSKLQTITWQRMVEYVQDYQMQSVVFDAFYGCLLARRDRGAAILTLDLVGSKRLNMYQADKLKEVVDNVVVRQW
ncbi:hypothetical protein D9619_010049 [Psilocybe cf. subviscida]|uniref:F-box domain-containing protein n=1 Tax=Psilocybe cf. subviscida TaxID=2480587 RepID=A0A8H5F6V9_9AGAR|nr:hypothetical protein D9619_010049 [Psilocybe cf. subviscida]